MSTEKTFRPLAAIACGGSGGHLFPGLAVGEQLLARGCDVTLLISPKEVDQQAVQNLRDMTVVTLPAVGMTRGLQSLDLVCGPLDQRVAALLMGDDLA